VRREEPSFSTLLARLLSTKQFDSSMAAVLIRTRLDWGCSRPNTELWMQEWKEKSHHDLEFHPLLVCKLLVPFAGFELLAKGNNSEHWWGLFFSVTLVTLSSYRGWGWRIFQRCLSVPLQFGDLQRSPISRFVSNILRLKLHNTSSLAAILPLPY